MLLLVPLGCLLLGSIFSYLLLLSYPSSQNIQQGSPAQRKSLDSTHELLCWFQQTGRWHRLSEPLLILEMLCQQSLLDQG